MYKINTLLKANHKLFHTGDIALLWQITNKNTLYTTIKRYVKRGIFIPVHKGFYSVIPLEQIDPLELGNGYLHNFAYLSCESILVENGIIFQNLPYITLLSNRSARFTLANHKFMVRKLADKYLYNPLGIISVNNVYKAESERAVADILYFQPRYYFDAKDRIDWQKVKMIKKEVYSL